MSKEVKMYRFKDENGLGDSFSVKNRLYRFEEEDGSTFALSNPVGRDIDVLPSRLEELPGCPEVYVGDTFTLSNVGETYPNYKTLLEAVGLVGTTLDLNHDDNQTWEVVTITQHLERREELVVIGKNPQYPDEFLLVDIRGVAFDKFKTQEKSAGDVILGLVGEAATYRKELDDALVAEAAATNVLNEVRRKVKDLNTKIACVETTLSKYGLKLVS